MKKIVLIFFAVLITFVIETPLLFESRSTRFQQKCRERRALLYQAGAQDVVITVSPDTSVNAIYLHRENAAWSGIVFHGWKESKEVYQPLVELFPHTSWLLVDIKHDVDRQLAGKQIAAICQWLKAREKDPVIGFGFSLGGIALVNAAAHNYCAFDGIIIDGVASTLRTGVRDYSWHFASPLLWAWSWFMQDEAVVDMLSRVTSPLLIMHAKHDPVIPSSHAFSLHAALPHENLYIYDCDAHCRGHRLVPEVWRDTVEHFIASIQAINQK